MLTTLRLQAGELINSIRNGLFNSRFQILINDRRPWIKCLNIDRCSIVILFKNWLRCRSTGHAFSHQHLQVSHFSSLANCPVDVIVIDNWTLIILMIFLKATWRETGTYVIGGLIAVLVHDRQDGPDLP